MNNLEPILQIISIIVFISGGITFFFKTGEYKTTIDNQLKTLAKEIEKNAKEIEEIKTDIDKTKTDNIAVTSRLEALLIEVKTKLELLMQFSGWKNEKD